MHNLNFDEPNRRSIFWMPSCFISRQLSDALSENVKASDRCRVCRAVSLRSTALLRHHSSSFSFRSPRSRSSSHIPRSSTFPPTPESSSSSSLPRLLSSRFHHHYHHNHHHHHHDHHHHHHHHLHITISNAAAEFQISTCFHISSFLSTFSASRFFFHHILPLEHRSPSPPLAPARTLSSILLLVLLSILLILLLLLPHQFPNVG